MDCYTQIPFRLQPILQGPAFLPAPLLIQFVGALGNVGVINRSSFECLCHQAGLLTAQTSVGRRR